jgi:hypothetical protein
MGPRIFQLDFEFILPAFYPVVVSTLSHLDWGVPQEGRDGLQADAVRQKICSQDVTKKMWIGPRYAADSNTLAKDFW